MSKLWSTAIWLTSPVGRVFGVTIQRYKIELVLGIIAVLFSYTFILGDIVINDWGETTRTKLFTLFAIVGLIGLSVGIKRNELMTLERRDFSNKARNERLHACLSRISNDTSLALFYGTLSELEDIAKEVSEKDRDLILKILAVFIQSYRLWRPNIRKSDAPSARAFEEAETQRRKINEAFRTVHKMTSGKPISYLAKNKISGQIDLSNLHIQGEDMKLDGEDFSACNIDGLRFENTGITNCKFRHSHRLQIENFKEVQVDGTDFGKAFIDQEKWGVNIGNADEQEIIRHIIGRIFFLENEPLNLAENEEINKKLVKAAKHDTTRPQTGGRL